MRRKVAVFLLFVLLIPTPTFAEEVNSKEVVTLSKCVDGDTAKFTIGGNEIVSARFLAVDTPETVHPTKGVEPYGKEASNYTCSVLTNAKKIEIEYDSASDKKDHYDRILVWVFVDDELLQANLVKQGYAEVTYLYGDYKYTSLLKDYEAVAQVEKKGIWSSQNNNATSEVDSKKTPTPKKQKQKKKNKTFFENIYDATLKKIFEKINGFIENIVKEIQNML